MEKDQQEKYMAALAGAIGLVVGPRDADYNKGGIGLRDYWTINGIKSPLQMVDMKLKRALSQVSTWKKNADGNLVPENVEQLGKITESMLDLINYAAFTVCEAVSLYENSNSYPVGLLESPKFPLSKRLSEAVRLWQQEGQ